MSNGTEPRNINYGFFPYAKQELFIELEQAEYDRLKQSREHFFTVLAIEETFDYIIENYREFESTCLEIALDNIIRFMSDWSRTVSSIHEMSRRVVNFLTTARMYLDHVPQHLNDLFGKGSEETTEFEKATHREYDSSLSYRLLEALRNHAQHHGYVIHEMTRYSKGLN